jgi:flagellar biosynthesis/type III secretory pathway M-ring protein FliF/YscJ
VPALEAAVFTGTAYHYQQLSTLAKNQPQAVASVIKAWLDEK